MSSSPKKRVLFVGESVTLAHIARPLVLAQALDIARYEIHFACDERYAFVLEGTPFQRWNIQSIPGEQFLHNHAVGSPAYDQVSLENYVTDDLRLLEQVQPDLVVGDFRLSLAVSAPTSNVPYAAIVNAHWSPYTCRRWFPMPDLPIARRLGVPLASAAFRLAQPVGFAYHARPINAVRRKYGLPKLPNVLEAYTHSDHTLYADIPSLVPTKNLPKTHEYLGGIVWSPNIPLPTWWEKLDPQQPAAYVTLGSSGPTNVLPRVLEAMDSLSIQTMVATAGRVQVDHRSPKLFTADYLPGTETAARSRVVVCNGGSASIYQALSVGVPVLGIASNMDQFLTMEAVVKAGAGILLRASTTTADKVRESAALLLDDESYRAAASNLAEEMSKYNPGQRFADFLSRVLLPFREESRELAASPRSGYHLPE